jgi:predicted CoA-binding protein
MFIGSDDYLRTAFQTKRRVAILGASLNPKRAGSYVSRYLLRHGFAIFPVNPRYEGRYLEGRAFVSSLSEIGEPIDIINIFRSSDLLTEHVPEIIGLPHLPSLAWFQPGSENSEVASTLKSAGIAVIKERCILAEHKRLH